MTHLFRMNGQLYALNWYLYYNNCETILHFIER